MSAAYPAYSIGESFRQSALELKNPRSLAGCALFLALGVVNLIGGIRLLIGHTYESAWISLSVAFLMLYIGALMIVKNIRERGREDE